MRKHLFLFALLLSAVFAVQQTVAEDTSSRVAVVSTLPCKIYGESINETLDFKTAGTGNAWYYSSEWPHPVAVASYFEIHDNHVIRAEKVVKMVFKGWYTLGETLISDDPPVGNATVLVSTEQEITGRSIRDAMVIPGGSKGWKLSNKTAPIPFVVAKYIPLYAITADVSPSEGGTASVSPAQGPYEEGSTVTLSATENAAYKLAYWRKGASKVSDSDGKLSLVIKATEDAAYTAFFTNKTYTVTFHDPSGTYSDEVQTVTHGQPATAPNWSRTGYSLDWDKSFSSITADTGVNAKWTAGQYTVTYNGNGGTPSSASKTVTYGTAYGTLASCSRTGYTFGGWWTQKTGGTKIETTTTVTITADHTLYAHWTANTYTVKFSSNGGTETMSDQPFTYDVAQALPANSFKRTGHTFTGWNTVSTGTGTAYGDRETVSNLTATAGGTVYLYAQWQANTYYVRFNANGGEGMMVDQAFTYAQGQNLNPNLFTKGGYTFTGWCTVPGGVGGTTYPDGAYVNNLSEVNNSIVLLYAQWAGQAFTVTFDSNGGDSPNPSSKTVNYASTYGTLAKCSWTGHAFGGWWTEKVGGSQVTETTTVKLDADQTLYAHWEAAKYDIHFMPGGGTGTMADQTGIEYGTEVVLSSNAFTKGIQRFRRWQGSDGKFYEDGAMVSNLLDTAGVHTNTATWRNDFLVAFDGNGATNTVMAAQLIDTDELPQTLKANEYRRPGYAFRYWEGVVAGKKQWYGDQATVTTALAPVGETNTLVAVWSTNSFTVAFFGNGGVGEMEPQPFTYDVPQALRANAFVRPGYDFLGWTRDPQSAAVEFADQATVSNLTTAADGVVPLYAKWSSTGSLTNPYSIAADCDKTDNAGVKLALTPDKAEWCTIVSNASDAVEGGNDQYVKLMPTPVGTGGDVSLSATLTGTGTLTFYYRTKIEYPTLDENYFIFSINGVDKIHEQDNVAVWSRKTYTKTNVEAETIAWKFHVGSSGGWLDGDYAFVDFIKWDPQPREALMVGVTFRLNDGTSAPDDIFTNITCEAGKAIGPLPVPVSEGRSFLGWMTTPEGDATIDAAWIVPNDEDGTQLYAKWSNGGEPTPGDPVEVTAASVTDGVFALTIPTESGTDYGVWTNADLTVDSWGLMGEPQEGEGEPLEFRWTILPEFPQLFFRAHKVEYK